MTRSRRVEDFETRVRNQLGIRIYKTKQLQSEQNITRGLQLQTLGPSCLEPHVSVSIKEQSRGMHTQEVPEPCQWLVRWSVWHCLRRDAGSGQCSAVRRRCENEASTRKLGAMSARTFVTSVRLEVTGYPARRILIGRFFASRALISSASSRCS